MVARDRHLYEFGPFVLNAGERILLKGSSPVPLAPKAFEMLVVLIQNSGRLISKDELMKAVWPDTVVVEEGNLSLNISLIRKALGDSAAEPQYVETVPKWGYRFVAPVHRRAGDGSESAQEEAAGAIANTPRVGVAAANPAEIRESVQSRGHNTQQPRTADETEADKIVRIFGGHLWHVLLSCTLYALLYSFALLVEVAYQFDRYGRTALKIAPLVFLWTFCTSATGLWVDSRWILHGEKTGLAFSLIICISASLLLYVGLSQFLSHHPITEAEFQTYPARGAYLKSVYYFLPLWIIFMILPFHFVVSIQKELRDGRQGAVLALLLGRRRGTPPAGAIYLNPRWLLVLLAVAAPIALAVLAHLFENLKPDTYSGLFLQLVQWRSLIYFILGMECLVWYFWMLNEIKRECLRVETREGY